ncbi:helix-turn-helix domain-containing protein [Viridibacillus arvi]|uniref:helix-turn-helix domain-containing protein n=1 Tax=Viridibacillus arvi TaxID=263475 RepID=UPI0034CFBF59
MRIKEILDERKMTQKELAAASGLTEATISMLVKNKRDTVNRQHIAQVAKALDITDFNMLFKFN